MTDTHIYIPQKIITWHWLYLLLSTLQLRDDEHLDSRLYAFRTCTSFELYWRLRRPHDICEFLTSFSDSPECKSPRLLKLKWNQAASSQLLYNSEYLCAKCQFLSVFDDFLHCPTYLLQQKINGIVVEKYWNLHRINHPHWILGTRVFGVRRNSLRSGVKNDSYGFCCQASCSTYYLISFIFNSTSFSLWCAVWFKVLQL